MDPRRSAHLKAQTSQGSGSSLKQNSMCRDTPEHIAGRGNARRYSSRVFVRLSPNQSRDRAKDCTCFALSNLKLVGCVAGLLCRGTTA